MTGNKGEKEGVGPLLDHSMCLSVSSQNSPRDVNSTLSRGWLLWLRLSCSRGLSSLPSCFLIPAEEQKATTRLHILRVTQAASHDVHSLYTPHLQHGGLEQELTIAVCRQVEQLEDTLHSLQQILGCWYLVLQCSLMFCLVGFGGVIPQKM